MPTPMLTEVLGPKDAIDYNSLHEENMKKALEEALEEAAQNCAYENSFTDDTFEWIGSKRNGGPVADRRNLMLPKGVLAKKPTKGTKILIGGLAVETQNELGRGGYGVVLLCKLFDRKGTCDRKRFVAVKIQQPIGSLAWEYHILTKLEERLPENKGLRRSRRYRQESFNDPDISMKIEQNASAFPKALSLCAYSDGGLLGMTAGSQSGLNLVDVVNTFRKAGAGSVPELLAIHYTSKMLMHLETLHWHGKILHCDVKPDNWVLTASTIKSDAENKMEVNGYDLMLVDFGRAIDLDIASSISKTDPLDVKLFGNMSAEDMACVAMQNNMAWGLDVDTFGLCASAHVLLFGSYMNMDKDSSSGRWKPQKSFRRYWQKDLWTDLFDTLLNVENKSKNAMHSSSHPNSLRAIRKSFDNFLNEGNRRKEVVSLLNYQASITKNIK